MTTASNSNERLLKILQASPDIQAQIDRILEGKAPTGSHPPTGPLLYSMTTAAKLLGTSRATIWRICRAKKLSRVELFPGSYRIRRADLEALVAGKAVEQ